MSKSLKTTAILLGASLAAQPAMAVRGPRGGAAAVGPRGGAAAVGPRGGAAAVGPHGGGAAVGPYGGAAARGPYGGAAARGPYGGTAARTSYMHGGVTYARPGWNATQINVYGRPYFGYPGWHGYGVYYGLAPGLMAFSSLAFLSAGLLIGSYMEHEKTVYVYVVNEGDKSTEYRVDEEGHVLSQKPAPMPPE